MIDDVVVSADVGAMKPDPAIFRAALERNGFEAARTTFVDDSPANVAGAAVAGLDAIRFIDADTLRAELAARGLPG